MEKLLHERLREAVDKATSRGDYEIGINVDGDSIVIDTTDAMSIANNIERDYIPRSEHDAEIERIVEARGDSGTVEELSNKVMRIYAMHKGMPMEDGDGISKWLDRWFVRLSCDGMGKPWKMDDPIVFPEEGETTIDFFRFEDGEMRPGSYVGGGAVSYSPEDCKRPAPKVLDADDVEIKEEETLYGTGREQHCYTVQNPYSIKKEAVERFCVQCYDHNDGVVVWCDPSMLTHREPDSLEKLRDDMKRYIGRGLFDPEKQYSIALDRLTALIERGA